jgi:hypothetical protein
MFALLLRDHDVIAVRGVGLRPLTTGNVRGNRGASTSFTCAARVRSSVHSRRARSRQATSKMPGPTVSSHRGPSARVPGSSWFAAAPRTLRRRARGGERWRPQPREGVRDRRLVEAVRLDVRVVAGPAARIWHTEQAGPAAFGDRGDEGEPAGVYERHGSRRRRPTRWNEPARDESDEGPRLVERRNGLGESGTDRLHELEAATAQDRQQVSRNATGALGFLRCGAGRRAAIRGSCRTVRAARTRRRMGCRARKSLH